jgi:UDP-N-acetylglucosamine 1-carboxyvinyltransferase
MNKFIIKGGKPLRGTVQVSGSKNATLPILAATLLTDKECILHGVPDISDVHLLLEVLGSLGAEYSYDHGTLRIQTKQIKTTEVPKELATKMRASILLLGPLLARTGQIQLPFPGGCVIGKRSTHAHTYAMEQLGATDCSTASALCMTAKDGIRPTAFNLPEMSVTATENAIMAATLTPGETKIRMAAYEPHVVDLCHFLVKMGVQIDGIGTHTVKVRGTKKPKGVTHTITTDYLEVGTFAIAALVTGGQVRIEGVVPKQLDSFFQKLTEIGADFTVGPDYLEIRKSKKKLQATRIQTAVFPGFPTDLQAPMGVLLTQVHGKNRIFETLFEGRLSYLYELEKMKAQVEMLNSHEAIVFGPTQLKGAAVVSCDLRAGAAVVLAALAARGTSEIYDVRYIDRGYERLDEKLRSLGAEIRRTD